MLLYDDKDATKTDHFWGLSLMTFIWVKPDHILRRKYFLISDGVLHCLNCGQGALPAANLTKSVHILRERLS